MPKTRGYTLSTLSHTGTRTGSLTMRGNVIGGVQVFGVAEAIAKINAAGQLAHRQLGLIVYRGAQRGLQVAKAGAPRGETGVLLRGIHMEKRGVYHQSIVSDTEGADPPRQYAGYQEFGYHDRGGNWHPGVGYMRKATEQMTTYVRAEIVKLAAMIEAI